MKFGLFVELQHPRPWSDGSELALFQEGLDQVELADQLGYDYVWAVEHHFLEEYAHSSAPEVFLAAASQRSKRLRLGTGITLMPPAYNHPARVAERIATLDLVSGGRLDFGTGESSSRVELEGFGVPLERKREMWLEATEQVANMLAMDPYPGFEGEHFSMPARNVVPKGVQRPHPPMWMACSNSGAIEMAARLGLGALTFVTVAPDVAKQWIDNYYRIIKTECVPIGHTVNPRVALTAPLSIDPDEQAARRVGLEGRLFFQLAAAHFYVDGIHRPGRTDLWREFERARGALEASVLPPGSPSSVGTPEQARRLMAAYRDAGADQVMFMAQMGRISHESTCRSLQIFAEEVMPEFQAGEVEREAERVHALAPYIAQALERKQWMRAPEDDEIPEFAAYKREVAEHGRSAGGQLETDSWQEGLRRVMHDAGVAEEPR